MPTSSEDGELIAGRYRLGRVIARGGMSTVHEAVHEITGRGVALKVTSGAAADAAELRARMHVEARALGAIRHRNVVGVHDAGDLADGRAFLALELLDGKPLDALLAARRTLTPADAAWIGVEVAMGLAAAHDCSIAHRDVKPSNVLVVHGDDGEEAVKLIDFGIAAVFGLHAAAEDLRLTRRGEIIGTAEYCSPERLESAGPEDARSDVYALAVTLYELLTGDVPYPGSYRQVLIAMATLPLPPIANDDVPPELAAIVVRCLARDPTMRLATVRELARALHPFTRGPRSALLPPPASDVDPVEVELMSDPSARPPPLPNARRLFARASFVAPVCITHQNGTTLGKSEDLSEGGMLLVAQEAFPDDARALVRFTPPGLAHEVEVRAAVRWARTTRRGTVFGVEFVDAPPDLRAAAAAWAARGRGNSRLR